MVGIVMVDDGRPIAVSSGIVSSTSSFDGPRLCQLSSYACMPRTWVLMDDSGHQLSWTSAGGLVLPHIASSSNNSGLL